MRTPEILLQEAQKLEEYYKKHFPAVAKMAGLCFLNTIDTTVEQLTDGSYFVITGDIPAMWLRDSAAQVMLYTQFAREDAYLQEILEGIIAKQVQQVLIDPYANAFNKDDSNPAQGHQDSTERSAWIWERKYEVDSLCAPIYLSANYYRNTGRTEIFTEEWRKMTLCVIQTFRTEQHHETSPYYFERTNCPPSDTLPCAGKGTPVQPNGMTWSGFRPSDDACQYGYLIPSNMMAVVALKEISDIAQDIYHDAALAQSALMLAQEIEQAIESEGVVKHPQFGEIYAYEVDGLGNQNLMDDANSPSLLAIPYLGYRNASDARYRATRDFVLSSENPYYTEGAFAQGIGSPHTKKCFIWPIAITMRALTSEDRREVLEALDMLSRTHAGTYLMHESFDPNDPTKFSRPWFAWANSLFATLLVKLMNEEFF